jgi:dTDP-4-dehydrorhamnose reductase
MTMKRALVTGGSGDLGKAICIDLAKNNKWCNVAYSHEKIFKRCVFSFLIFKFEPKWPPFFKSLNIVTQSWLM